MKKPNYYRGKRPLPLSPSTYQSAFDVIERAGKQKAFLKELDDKGLRLSPTALVEKGRMKLAVEPEVVNFVKDFLHANSLHVGNHPDALAAADMVYSPNGRCP